MARILVVDDEAAHRDSLRRIFERAGHEVTVAKDGDEALVLLGRVPVDIILTDLVMPRVDGRTVLSTALKLRPENIAAVGPNPGAVEGFESLDEFDAGWQLGHLGRFGLCCRNSRGSGRRGA